jgi:hypothetical protein
VRATPAVETTEGTRWVELAACASHEVAYESDGHGDFTRALLQVLETAGTRTTHAGMMRRVLAAMPERQQTPQLRAPAGLERRTLVSRAAA